MADQDLEIRITTKGDTSGADKVSSSLGGLQQATGNQTKATKALGEASEQASGHTRGLGRAMYGLREIVGGLQFRRPTEAIRGLVNVTMGLGGSFMGLLAIITGPLVAGLLILRKVAGDNAKEMQKMWSDSAKSAEDYKVRLAAVTKAAEADLKAMLADVATLAKGYEGLVSSMGKANQRYAETQDAEKELALAKAKTPEERAQIESKYAAAGLQNAGLNAKLQRSAAEEALSGANVQTDNAARAVREAKANFAGKLSTTEAFAPTDNSPQALAARKAARAAQDAVKLAEDNAAKVAVEVSKVTDQAYEQIKAAEHTQRLTGIKKQTAVATTQGRINTLSQLPATDTSALTAAQQRQVDLRSQIEAAGNADVMGSGFGQHTDVSKLQSQLKAAQDAEASAYATIARDSAARKKQADLLAQQMKNQRESGGL